MLEDAVFMGGDLMMKFREDRKIDLICLGRAAIDFNPIDYNRPLNESTTFKKYIGGSPANIAIGLARLGKKVGFIGKLSKDQFGKFIYDGFEAESIDTGSLSYAADNEKTGLTFTEILDENTSSILMYRHNVADLRLDPVDVDESYVASAKALLISGTSLAESPSREAALKAMTYAKKHDVRLIFDIDYRPYNWKSQDEISIYYSLLAHQADLIMGSREEYDLTERLIFDDSDDIKSSEYWLKQKASIVVIKHGKKGSTAYTGNGEQFNIKPFPVKALKGFGGGDGYAAAFIFGLLEGKSIIDCLEMGSAEAAMLVASHACSADMPSLQELEEFIKKTKEEYGEMIARE